MLPLAAQIGCLHSLAKNKDYELKIQMVRCVLFVRQNAAHAKVYAGSRRTHPAKNCFGSSMGSQHPFSESNTGIVPWAEIHGTSWH